MPGLVRKINVAPPVAVVNSFNEWDPLEEVIVGTLDGAASPSWETPVEAIIHKKYRAEVKKNLTNRAGKKVPENFAAKVGLAEFIRILQGEGVTVRRPEPLNHAAKFGTPHWRVNGGNNQANPRDVLIVFGNEILESTMSWHSRYFEFFAYRKLLKEYFKKGAVWAAAPKPELTNDLYNPNFKPGRDYVLTEFEPVFDAADITRCGRDIFVQKSHVTNDFGIAWLTQHLGEKYRVHKVEFKDDRAIHIDATFVPLAPGKLLVNPDRPIKDARLFKKAGWEFLPCPPTTLPKNSKFFEAYKWFGMNVLSLDEKRIIVEKNEVPLIKALKRWGFEPIPCNFRANYAYGGSFHCATVDVRRRGTLKSYF